MVPDSIRFGPHGDRFGTVIVIDGSTVVRPSRTPTPTTTFMTPTAEPTVYRREQLGSRSIPTSVAPAPHITVNVNEKWDHFYTGAHYLEADDATNPVNDDPNYPSVSITYPGTTPQATAIEQCASFALSQIEPYWAIQVYYSNSQDLWVCQAFIRWFYQDRSTASDFKVENLDADPVFGYEYNLPGEENQPTASA
ncbi:hypothetical protein CI109_101961 [Kwoniella shandongensis]|uniref:Uncharacterized protein n=1 Tax=Kwoniella shandongensis TaxID=1734106 RepID=A0AAJ8LHR3_9TREE